jgi:hypothetical protein
MANLKRYYDSSNESAQEINWQGETHITIKFDGNLSIIPHPISMYFLSIFLISP